MKSMLCLESGGVRMVGIVGPSGIGKTTIARALYSRLSSSQFDHRAFLSYKRTIQDRKIADFCMKLTWVKHFLSEILCQKDIKIESLGMVEQRLKRRKVLIVLDDVDEIELLETLVGRIGWFGFGSRIIVVTQDRALLKSHEIEFIHEVQFPSEYLALQMFCQSTFGKTSPPDGFMKLAAEVANISGLNVMGSSLRGKDKDTWVEMMPRLRNGLNGKIHKTLRVSYDGLDEKDDQDIFLHIACLFNGERVKHIKNLLGGSVTIGLQVLADKSLIRLTPPCNTVHMHTLLEKLGREIVRAESTNPGKRRFLVDAKDISDVFEDNTGTDSVLAISCNTSDIKEPLLVNEKSLKQMRNLQFIKFYSVLMHSELMQIHHFCEHCRAREVRFNLLGGLIYLPHKLRLLYWDKYPAKHLPCNFSTKYLVELIMRYSELEKLWEGAQPLRSEIPDLSNATNLEILNLCYCTSLVTLHSSIRNLKNLRELSMVGCSNLEALPTDVNLESLDYLNLRECSRLRSVPQISRNISKLVLDGTAMEEEDCLWIENLSRLTLLDWANCPLKSMPSNFNSEHLTELIMRKSKLEKLWEGYKSLRILMVMSFENSKNLKEIPNLSKAMNLMSLDLSGCESLKEIPDLPKAINLEYLNLNNCKSLVKVPLSIQNLDKLTSLNMIECTSLEVLPTNINLVSLTSLDLSGCSHLTTFPQLSTSIEDLNLKETAIEEVPSWIENIAGLTSLWMRGCQKLKAVSAAIWNFKHLKHVDFTDCGGLTSVSDARHAGLHAESSENYPMDMYPSWPCSNSAFLFCDCFNLDRDAQKFILQSHSRFAVLPGKEVPTYFTYRTCGSSLTVPLPQNSVSQTHLRFMACIDFAAEVDVHWKSRGVTGMCNTDFGTYLYKVDHLFVFHFDFCPQKEVDGPPSQLDCNNVEFEFKLRSTGFLCCTKDLQTIPIFHGKIKGCGVRVLNVSPSLVANVQSGESDVESGRSTKRKQMMTVETSEENSSSLCGQTAVNSDSMAPNLSFL